MPVFTESHVAWFGAAQQLLAGGVGGGVGGGGGGVGGGVGDGVGVGVGLGEEPPAGVRLHTLFAS